jgi:hypothetical protein
MKKSAVFPRARSRFFMLLKKIMHPTPPVVFNPMPIAKGQISALRRTYCARIRLYYSISALK